MTNEHVNLRSLLETFSKIRTLLKRLDKFEVLSYLYSYLFKAIFL